MTKAINSRALVILMGFVLVLAFALSAEARPSNKWRLHFNGKADKDGTYVIKMTPEDGKPEVATVDIKKGTRENEAARETSRALKRHTSGYDIDYEDGEEVQVRARVGSDDFTIDVEESIPGLNIRVERE